MEFDSTDDAWDWLALRLTTAEGYLPPPEAFDRFEAQFGVRLPGGYRSFASRFGAGLLAGYFRVAVPDNPNGVTWFDLDRLNQHSVRGCSAEWIEEVHCFGVPEQEVAGVVAQVRRLVFFASLEGSEYVGWDPEDVRDSEAPEYGVYILPRLAPPVYCAYSFEQFVFDICLGERYPDCIPTDRAAWREDREPYLWVY